MRNPKGFMQEVARERTKLRDEAALRVVELAAAISQIHPQEFDSTVERASRLALEHAKREFEKYE